MYDSNTRITEVGTNRYLVESKSKNTISLMRNTMTLAMGNKSFPIVMFDRPSTNPHAPYSNSTIAIIAEDE
ncbi:MAG: hypothetical protein NVSMB46_08980 [Candidatus Saccharimonadales bacterium]